MHLPCRNAPVRRALVSLDEMRGVQLQHNVATYSATICACAKGHRWQKTPEVLGEMRGAQLQSDVATCFAAHIACEKGQRWQISAGKPERTCEAFCTRSNSAVGAQNIKMCGMQFLFQLRNANGSVADASAAVARRSEAHLCAI